MTVKAHVEVSNLRVAAEDAQGRQFVIVRDVSFSIPRGEVLAIIGESGSGKTTIALALMGHTRPGCRIDGGSITIGDTEITALAADQLRAQRGRTISYVAQSAAASFNPSRSIMNQVIESAMIHGLMSRREAQAKARELFHELALPDPDNIGERYPHQLSGGQLQRAMAAMALVTDPDLVIFDEPTTALDVTTQIDVLRAFKRVIRERGTTAVYVSHDLAVVAQMADRIIVLSHGQVREAGDTAQVLHAPEDAYTQSLMAAARPEPHADCVPSQGETLLEVRDLVAGYGRLDRQGMPATTILKGIDLQITRGATLGVIGESGSGKSTLARVIAGLLSPARGSVLLNGEKLPPTLKGRSKEQFRRVQIVFQNADTALNPAHTVSRVLGRPLSFYHGLQGDAQSARVAELLSLVRLPVDLAKRRCGELSGGQKQRINLARALAAEPDLILCDEVTSALDTVVGAAILELMAELREKLQVSYLFISHDISTVRAICDDIVVLYDGSQVEQGSRQSFRNPPFHPYTELLISSVPELAQGWLETAGFFEEPAEMGACEDGVALCRFLDRCPVRIDGICNVSPAPRITMPDGNRVLCHHSAAELVKMGGVQPRV